MSDPLDFVLEAHGGLERWSGVSALTAKPAAGGPFWGQPGFPDAVDGRDVVADAMTLLESYELADAARRDYLDSYIGTRFADSAVRAQRPNRSRHVSDLLSKIRTPVQIIAGEQDPLIPLPHAEYLHERLPCSTLAVLSTGHFAWEDGAEESYRNGLDPGRIPGREGPGRGRGCPRGGTTMKPPPAGHTGRSPVGGRGRRATRPHRQRTGFVLSGGASLGALQVGMLHALYEHGIIADLLVGTSIGALNAAFVASRPQTPATAQEPARVRTRGPAPPHRL